MDLALYVPYMRKAYGPSNVRSTRQLEEYFSTLGFWCYWCCGPFQCVDHVWPRKLGGTNNMINLVPSCVDCNTRKSDLDLPYWCRTLGIPYPIPVGERLALV